MSSEQSINTRALQNSNVANVALELDKKKTPNILKKRVNINHLLVCAALKFSELVTRYSQIYNKSIRENNKD